MRPRIYTDDQLRRVLASGECRTWMDATVALGLGSFDNNRARVHSRAIELGLGLHGDPRSIPTPLGNHKRPTPSGVDGGREGR